MIHYEYLALSLLGLSLLELLILVWAVGASADVFINIYIIGLIFY